MKKLVLPGLLTTCALTAAPLMANDFSDHRVVMTTIEFLTTGENGMAGGIEILRKDLGNGQLTQDFVYDDPRSSWRTGPGVHYGIKTGNLTDDVNVSDEVGSMRLAVDTWDAQGCSNMMLVENAVDPVSQGLVQKFFNTGIIDLSLTEADVTQVGFLGGADFPYFAANTNVLGVAFTLSWVDGSGNLTDIDTNGKADVAVREIYYNDDFEWSDAEIAPDGTIDFPTVAIHEMGHGFSMAHFGMIARKKGELVAHPRAIMNAIYGGQLREPTGRDKGSHCANWAQWPNN
ncbi:hypothetical protein [Lacimicrobium sp. SS2-24]|uniref:hypothetical protein n=1 Tax=Lacimicrobium sp. SS2-24 TaxID=2005569 RepID=UPI000B4A6C4D|nr:hypothetical protein [Lacimicrobium sp. SS2-24]